MIFVFRKLSSVSASQFWPRPWPRRFGLGLGLKKLSSFSITVFLHLVISFMADSIWHAYLRHHEETCCKPKWLYSFSHFTLILLLHYLVKCRICSLAVYNKKLSYRLENKTSVRCILLIIMLYSPAFGFLSLDIRYLWNFSKNACKCTARKPSCS